MDHHPGVGRAAPWPGAVDVLRRDPEHSGVLMDFDGTLAAIVDDPAAARPLPGSLVVLRALVRVYRLVAVVSGRPGAFLATHLDVPGLVRVGAYGLEQVGERGIVASPATESWREIVDGVARRAVAAAPPGVLIEDKGISVTFHYRTAPDAAPWAHAFAEAEAGTTGLVTYGARCSVELRPPLTVDKGTAIAELLSARALSAACFCGDDAGDLAAFAALDALPTALRVAAQSDETPTALITAADLVVDGPRGVLALLRALAA
jgi:trehalose 6-phosphate phosphatase